MLIKIDDVVYLARRLYLIGVAIYVLSLAGSVLWPYVIYQSEAGVLGQPAQGVLPFLALQIQSLTSPIVAVICVIVAFILHPTLTSRIRSRTDRGGSTDTDL
ncbi:MAG: hypothetical protein Q4P06_04295 [Actinomycetaceae bacterium]|nr:hypothetical protein [Actinomycetaceae bacterium]